MKKRVISAIIALIICIPLLIIGGYPFYIGVSILSAIGYYEIINIRERERKVPLTIKIIGLITYLMIVLNNVVSSIMFYIDYKVLAITAFLLMLPIIFFDRKKYNVNDALYLIGTSEHSMIAKFKDQILKESDLPITMTSYSPCFRKETGAHGIEERGIYRIHQFEKQEMVVLCKKEESDFWYEKMWSYSVELFRNLNIPVRKLICCSGDLADLKYRSCDIEAWSPRQQKYFEVCSCSNLTDAQARRLGIRYKKENGEKEYVHTLNDTVIAPPRMLIAFLENNLNVDGTVNIPIPLRPYMGNKTKIG